MAIAPNTTFVAGNIFTAAQANAFPRGVMGNVTRTAGNFTMSTSVADITGMTITWTAFANRTYKFTWTVTGYKQTAEGWAAVLLAETGNTVYGIVYATPKIVGTEGYFNLSGTAYKSDLGAGTQTFKLRAQLENASGTILASGTNPCFFMVEDLGPS